MCRRQCLVFPTVHEPVGGSTEVRWAHGPSDPSPGIVNFSSCVMAKSWKVMKARIKRLVPSFIFPFNNSYSLYQSTWQGKMENGAWSSPWIPGSAPVITPNAAKSYFFPNFFFSTHRNRKSLWHCQWRKDSRLWGPSPCGQFWLKPWFIAFEAEAAK